MRWQKRGGIAITTLIELGIVVLLALAFINATGLITDKESVLDLYIARDISRITESLHTTTFDVSYTYPQSFDRTLLVEGNAITVAPSDSIVIAGQSLSYIKEKYQSSAIFGVMSSVALDASFFSINKIFSKIIFVNGRFNQEEQLLLQEMFDKNILKKEDIVVEITTSSGTINEKVIIEELRKNILSDLEAEGFNVNGDSNLRIHLQFEDDYRSSVVYSSYQETQTKPLAEEINRLLANQLKFVSHPFEQVEEGSIATVTIKISSWGDTLSKFEEISDEDKGTKQIFAKRVALALANYYS